MRAGMRPGDKIRKIREAIGMSLSQLAERSGVSENTILNVEMGRVDPKLQTLKRIADAMSTTVEHLIKEAA